MSVILIVLTIIFLASLIKAVLGFGEALIGVPLLTLFVGIRTATPLIGLIGVIITLFLLIKHRQSLDLSAVWRLILSAALGIPFGLLLLNAIPTHIVNLLLGMMLIFYSLYTLFQPDWIKFESVRWTYLFGFVAGVLSSAYNIGGPPLVMYANARRWSPAQFMGALQSFFLPVSIMSVIGQGITGLWTPTVFVLFGLALPIILLAFVVGSLISHRIPADQFTRWVRVSLLILGVVLVLKS